MSRSVPNSGAPASVRKIFQPFRCCDVGRFHLGMGQFLFAAPGGQIGYTRNGRDVQTASRRATDRLRHGVPPTASAPSRANARISAGSRNSAPQTARY